jgi:hypothetical protein
LDNVFDANPRAWAHEGAKTAGCIGVSGCTQDWDIVGNECIDFRNALWVSSKDDIECTTRPVDDVRFDRNIYRNTFAWQNPIGVWVHQEDLEPKQGLTCDTNTDLLNYSITNNFLSSTTGWLACYVDEDGNNCRIDQGLAVFANNTCHGHLTKSGAGAINIGDDPTWPKNPTNRQRNYIIKNNVISGLGVSGAASRRNINVNPAPPNLQLDGNVYDPDGTFGWRGTTIDSLSLWRNASGGDANAHSCNVAFVDTGAGDFHLRSTDTCARDAGVDLSTRTLVDIDGGNRADGGAWDTGADEFGVSGAEGDTPVPLPSPPPDDPGDPPPPDDPDDPIPPPGDPGALPAPVLREAVPLPQ